MSAEVSLRRLRGVDVVQLAGDVDASNAADVAARVAELTRPDRPVVFDLTAVRFIDSAGVRVLDAAAGDARARGVGVRVVAPGSGAVALALRVTAFPEGLVVRSVTDAMGALG